jgi:lambda family phage portal protein
MNAFQNLLGRIGAALYNAAELNRHHSQLVSGRQSKQDEDHGVKELDRTRIRQVCLDLRRNNPIVAAITQRFADNVVGARIVPQAQTSDPEWNELAEGWYGEWEKAADARQRLTLPEIERMIIETRLVTGDMGFVLTDGGQLQFIEGERIVTPTSEAANRNIVEGVRVDPKFNIPVGFYVFSRDSNGRIDPASKQYTYVPRENFVFITNAFRPDQVRSLPDLTPAVDTIRHLDVLTDATLEKAKLDAMHAWFIPSPGGVPGMQGRKGYGTESVGAARYEKFESGQNYYGQTGETPESLASNTPNSQYESFVRNTLRAIGGALGIPYEFLILDFSQGSFASQRVGLLQTHRRFHALQLWLTNRFLQRVWNWRIAKAIKAGELPQAPIDARGVSEWYKVDWIYPEFGWSDPHREAQSQLMEYRMGTNTLTMMAKSKGRDPEEILREKGKDIASADRVAKEINAANGTALTWRDLIEVAAIAQERPQPVPQLENK